MEALEEVVGGGGGGGGGGSKEHTHIVKGKRTKRQRPQSPIPFSIAATHSSSGGGVGYDNNGDNFNKVSSPETSTEFIDSATEEEENMANCLILLAQGHESKNPIDLDDDDDDDNDMGLKFTSKRSAQAYQCKTCFRIFSSFQALGGHRASHTKPKPKEKRPTMIATTSSDEEQQQFKNKPLNTHSKSSSKVHECSICGAEFMSGQALGGHMRRHRAPPPIGTTTTATTTTSLSLRTSEFESDDLQEAKRARNVLSLDLDLNLPAPDVDDDHHQESKFCFASEQQKQQKQSHLVLSIAPALVDCHY
ncbi:unnamed protein product [Camellia sinensis]